MDLSMEMNATPRGTNDSPLAPYFGNVHMGAMHNAPLSWPEVDHHHGLAFYDAPSIDPWAEEDASKYIDANHPLIMGDHELDLLSDHSHSTTTDSDSRGSSNTFSTASLPSNGHSNLVQDSDWQHSQATYSPHGQAHIVPTVSSAPSLFSLMDTEHVANPFLLYASSDVDSPTIDPSTFREPLSRQILAHPHPDSPHLSAALEDRPYVSISELNAPYIPEGHDSVDADPKSLAFSDGLSPQPPSRKRSRSIEPPINDQSVTMAVQFAKVPLNLEAPIRGSLRSRRRAPSYSSSSEDESEDGPPLTKRSRRLSEKVKEESEYSDSGSTNVSRAAKTTRKSILKMSAADALAQLSGSTSSTMSLDPDSEWNPTDMAGATSIRRNNPIPMPVPVPHLTKKSRGRKVPYINTKVARGLSAANDGDDDKDGGRSGSNRRGRGGGRVGSGGRSFVCSVEGCGKCFIRGEHLKRHHTLVHIQDVASLSAEGTTSGNILPRLQVFFASSKRSFSVQSRMESNYHRAGTERIFPALYQSSGNVAVDRLAFIHVLEKLKMRYDVPSTRPRRGSRLKCFKVGDIAPSENISKEEKTRRESEAMKNFVYDMLHSTPAALRILELWKEYEEGQTDEAKFVKDLDRFEMASQALEYERHHGATTLQPFFDSSLPKIRHPEIQGWGTDLSEEREQARTQR
ncbi:hypothetical protein H0H92_008445 [Tricholoma furcatifolium]|nr:hypothetical protein H0H92_008445 [Tricholoma furcatifolium]